MSKVLHIRSLIGSVVLALAATSFAAQSQGGGLDLGGLVGGTVHGLTSGGIGAKAGATVGGSSGVDAKAKASIGKTVNAKAKVILLKKKHYAHKHHNGKHHNLVQISGKVDLNKKRYAHKHYREHQFVKLGGYKHVAQAKAIVKTDLIAAKIKIGISGTHNHPSTSQPPSSTPGAMASRLPDLSRSDRDRLVTRCVSVLAAPQKFDDTIVSLCRVATTL
jgi:hypothetical protein